MATDKELNISYIQKRIEILQNTPANAHTFPSKEQAEFAISELNRVLNFIKA